MTTFATNYNIEDIYVSENEKNSFDYLTKTMDYYIAQLVRQKSKIKKCRNLYEGIRDKDEFDYLESVFGIESPISVKMTPLIKTRIDVLVGLLLDETFTYKVSVNDNITLDKMQEQRKEERVKRILTAYRKQLHGNIGRVNKGQAPQQDVVTEKYLKRVEKLVNEKFISSFEIAAQALIKFFEQDTTIDLKQKIKQYFLDLLVTGEAYYRTSIPMDGSDPQLEICKPENIFFNKNTSHQFLSSGNEPNVNAVVHRYYLKRSEILTKWGHLLNEEDKKRLFGNRPSQSGHNIIESPAELEYATQRNNISLKENFSQYTFSSIDVLPIYHVEWLANNEVELSEEEKENLQKVDDITHRKDSHRFYGRKEGSGKPKNKGYRLDRYEGIRIGQDIYLELGKSRDILRSESTPWKTKLSYNGVSYNDRNNTPYSLAWALKDLQDTYDIVSFYRDNLVANSGVDGSRVNLAAIPKVLGQNFMERTLKWVALRKQGIELVDPTEAGAQLFQHYGDFKASLNAGAIEAIELVKEGIERQADIISGVNRHMYQAAEVRDAVANVKVGQQTTSLITKDIFELVHTSHKHVLEDLINRAKETYKTGKRGSYIVGDRVMLFDIMPDNFCFTDFNIYVINSSKENYKLQKIEALVNQLASKNTIGDDALIKIAMCESTTEILKIIDDSMEEKAMENDAIQQLSQQVEQLNQQLEEQSKQLEKAGQQIQAFESQGTELKVRELDLKEKEINSKISQAEKEIKLKDKEVTEEIKKDKAIVQLEREQIYAEEASGNSREVKNNF